MLQGCQNVGKAMSVPAAAILGGLIIITSFILSPASVKVPNTPWDEPVLVWLTISMPTGSRKTTIYKFLRILLKKIRLKANCPGALV
jgi:hypothetical protein